MRLSQSLELRCPVVLLCNPISVLFRSIVPPVKSWVTSYFSWSTEISWSVSFLFRYLIPKSYTTKVEFMYLSWCVQSPWLIISGAYP